MADSTDSTPTATSAMQWNYVDVQVIDGQRVLRPTHIAFDRLVFAEPPNLASQHVKIVITNNGQSHAASQALILPHEISATHIPIQLVNAEQKAPAKLTA